MRGTSIVAVLASLLIAEPAAADIVIVTGNSPQVNENVAFANQGPSSTILGSFGGGTGNFQVTGTTVGGANQFASSSAIITGNGSNITSINLGVTGGGLFNNLIINLPSTVSGTVSISILDNEDQTFITTFALDNGQNFFTIVGINGESIRTTSFTATTGYFTAASSIRAALVASGSSGVPETATWAMMLFGFTGIGTALRVRRRRSPLVAA